MTMVNKCHCQDCDPRQHEDCWADCLIWDCTSSWACCNDDCDNHEDEDDDASHS